MLPSGQAFAHLTARHLLLFFVGRLEKVIAATDRQELLSLCMFLCSADAPHATIATNKTMTETPEQQARTPLSEELKRGVRALL